MRNYWVRRTETKSVLITANSEGDAEEEACNLDREDARWNWETADYTAEETKDVA